MRFLNSQTTQPEGPGRQERALPGRKAHSGGRGGGGGGAGKFAFARSDDPARQRPQVLRSAAPHSRGRSLPELGPLPARPGGPRGAPGGIWGAPRRPLPPGPAPLRAAAGPAPPGPRGCRPTRPAPLPRPRRGAPPVPCGPLDRARTAPGPALIPTRVPQPGPDSRRLRGPPPPPPLPQPVRRGGAGTRGQARPPARPPARPGPARPNPAPGPPRETQPGPTRPCPARPGHGPSGPLPGPGTDSHTDSAWPQLPVQSGPQPCPSRLPTSGHRAPAPPPPPPPRPPQFPASPPPGTLAPGLRPGHSTCALALSVPPLHLYLSYLG